MTKKMTKWKECSCGAKIYKVSARCKSCSNRNRKGKYKLTVPRFNEKAPNWKGDKVQYGALHTWIRNNKPKPEFCECCEKVKPFDLANISQEYKRDVDDFEWLCRKCHMTKDNRILAIGKPQECGR